MKNLLSAAILFMVYLALSSDLYSQTWLTRQKHGGYFAAVMEITPVVKQNTIVAGGKAVWMFNGKIGIGGAYFDMVKNVESGYFDDTAGTYSLLHMNYGGMTIEYNQEVTEKLDLGAEVLLGGGGIRMVPKDRNKPYRDFYGNDFLVWVPSLNLSYKISPMIRVTFTAGYRKVTDFRPYLVHTGADFTDSRFALSFRFGEY